MNVQMQGLEVTVDLDLYAVRNSPDDPGFREQMETHNELAIGKIRHVLVQANKVWQDLLQSKPSYGDWEQVSKLRDALGSYRVDLFAARNETLDALHGIHLDQLTYWHRQLKDAEKKKNAALAAAKKRVEKHDAQYASIKQKVGGRTAENALNGRAHNDVKVAAEMKRIRDAKTRIMCIEKQELPRVEAERENLMRERSEFVVAQVT